MKLDRVLFSLRDAIIHQIHVRVLRQIKLEAEEEAHGAL
jgi:hypothetical protein